MAFIGLRRRVSVSVETRTGFRLLLDHTRGHRRLALGGGSLLGLSTLLKLPLPLVTRYVIDDLLLGGPDGAGGFDSAVAFLIAALVIQVAIVLAQDWVFAVFVERVVREIQVELYAHVSRAGSAELSSKPSGYLQARIVSDCERLRGVMATNIFRALRDLLTLIVGVSMLFYLSPTLATISLALVLPYGVTQYAFGQQARTRSARAQEESALFRGVLQEMLGAAKGIKIHMLHSFALKRVSDGAEAAKEANLDWARVSLLASAATGLIMGAAPLLVLWIAGREIIAGRMTIGTWLAFNTFLAYAFGPVGSLLNMNIVAQSSMAALHRIVALIRIPGEGDRFGRHPAAIGNVPEVRLRNVSFAHEDGKLALQGIDITIRPGETIAIVGPSGCGKSTLADLLLGLHVPTSGTIELDGVPMTDLPLDEIRARIGLILQASLVFSGSIAENVVAGTIEQGGKDPDGALRMTGADAIGEDLARRDGGEISEGGANLSGGERQRIALARACHRDRGVLILDEATSQLDSVSEEAIRNELISRRRGSTTIVIAHRLSNVAGLDRIVLMQNGQVRATGTHAELRDSNALYTELMRAYAAA